MVYNCLDEMYDEDYLPDQEQEFFTEQNIYSVVIEETSDHIKLLYDMVIGKYKSGDFVVYDSRVFSNLTLPKFYDWFIKYKGHGAYNPA